MKGVSMARRSVVVIDDFYATPDRVRNLALPCVYRPHPAGREAFIPDEAWDAAWRDLRHHIEDDVDGPCPKDPPYLQGKFRITTASDEDTRVAEVHSDLQQWAAIVYLTLPEHCHGGTALYRHRITGALSIEGALAAAASASRTESARIVADLRSSSPESFDEVGVIPMVFNRAVVLDVHQFHGTGRLFGHAVRDGRLTQHFEFYSGGPSSTVRANNR